MLNEPFDSDAPPPRVDGMPPRPRPGSALKTALIVAIPLIAVAGGLYWYHQRPPPAPPPVGPAATPAPAAPLPLAALPEQEVRAAKALQSGEGSDARLRAQLGQLSARPEWLRWVAATPDLVESAVVILANVSDDDDPRKRLAPLRVEGPFDTLDSPSGTFESEASWHRFDADTEVIESLDARAVASLWRTLHPLLAVAYHSVARPGVSLDRAAGNALKRIELMQIPATTPAVKQVGKLWLYADPNLESLGSMEKQLLRVGPVNARKLQAKARELRAVMTLP